MKKLLLAMALVLVIAIPVFAQNHGPLKVKPLLVYTFDGSGSITAWFGAGEAINLRTNWEVKGTGTFRARLEVRNSAGVLIDKKTKTIPIDVDSPTFERYVGDFYPTPGVLEEAKYYTLKVVYVDLATGNTWSHQTKIYVAAPV
jgi:hypothetical protein